MKDFLISTDTTADLPDNYVKENNIDIHTLFYAFGEVIYGTDNTMPEKEFFDRMRKGEMPTTMACNPQDCKTIFEKRVNEGFDILHIAFSSALSSSYNNACIAANEVMEEHPGARIVVIDSLAASMGEGLIVYKAIEMKKSGKSMDEIIDFVNEHKLNVVHNFTVDDLNHLYRGGRVSKTTAIIGTLANIKPILHVNNEGRLINIGKVRGRKKSLIALVDRMEEHIGSYRDKNDIVFISHGDCLQDAQFVAGLVKERFGIDNIWINYICPTIGTHSGPGTVALFFMGESRYIYMQNWQGVYHPASSFICSTNVFTSTGLDISPFMPIFCNISISVPKPSAVIAIIGTSVHFPFLVLIIFVVSIPSIPGILTSIRTASMSSACSLSSSSIAELPSSAS